MSTKTRDPIAVLRSVVDGCGTQKAAAARLGISQAFMSDLLRGRRTFSDAMLAKLGLRRETVRA